MRAPLLVVNPAARGGRSAEHTALAAFQAVGLAPRLRRTTAPGDAARIAATEADDEPVFVLGGDGTVMEVVGALVGRETPVGVLPGGTGNQLAGLLGIPRHVPRAVRALVAAPTARLDLGRLDDGRHFAITAGFGLDAAMIAGASRAAKRHFGVLAYVWSVARALPAARPFRVRATVDGESLELDATVAMIANAGTVMGGRFAFGPDVSPTDGALDLCVFAPRGLAEGVGVAWRAARRDFRPDPRMLFRRGRDIRLEVETPVPAQADGELVPGRTLAATVLPGAARFLAPASAFAAGGSTRYVPDSPHFVPQR